MSNNMDYTERIQAVVEDGNTPLPIRACDLAMLLDTSVGRVPEEILDEIYKGAMLGHLESTKMQAAFDKFTSRLREKLEEQQEAERQEAEKN